MKLIYRQLRQPSACEFKKCNTPRLNNCMMKNITHQMADIDTIVEDEKSKATLLLQNLLPSSWRISKAEELCILRFGVKLKVIPKISGSWPACYVGLPNEIEIAEDFLNDEVFDRGEKIATMLHEVGHAFFKFEAKKAEISSDAENYYLNALDKYGGNDRQTKAMNEEFFADDFVRFCGFSKPLHSVLRKLDKIAEQRISRIEANDSLNPAFLS